MRNLLTTLTGVAFAVAFLVYCGGVPGAGGDVPDGGLSDDGGTDAGDSGSPVHRSGDRLKAVVLTSADGAVIPTGEWWDEELGIKCQPARAADGKTRCLPVGDVPWSFNGWADEDCTKKIAVFDRCDVPSGPFIVHRSRIGTESCSPFGHRVFLRGKLREDLSEGHYIIVNYDECRFLEVTARPVYEPGEEVPPETFALLAESVP